MFAPSVGDGRATLVRGINRVIRFLYIDHRSNERKPSKFKKRLSECRVASEMHAAGRYRLQLSMPCKASLLIGDKRAPESAKREW